MSYARFALVLGASALASASCSRGGGGGESTATVFAGNVRSPSGGAIERGSAELAPVPDGTTVALVRIDGNAETTEILATATTSSGAFSIEIDGVAPGYGLALVAGRGAAHMRALALTSATDVDPFSETTLALMLDEGMGLAGFTAPETRDVRAALELVVRTRGIALGDGVAETVALFGTAAIAEPMLMTFLAAASAAGQTSVGPGDIGDYFPTRVGDVWGYAVASNGNDELLSRRMVSDAAGTWTLHRRTPPDTATTTETFLETDSGVQRLASAGPHLFLGGVPSQVLRYPLRRGDTWVGIDAVGAAFGSDFDADGFADSVDARVFCTVAGFEDVFVPSGTFANCVRVDLAGVAVLHPSSNSADGIADGLTGSEWYAPGIGLVRRTMSCLGTNQTEELSSRLLAGEGRGILPPVSVADELGDPGDCYGSPTVATDGTNYFVVSARKSADIPTFIGTLVTPSGEVLRETALHTLLPTSDCPQQKIPVIFDGTNYMVAFVEQQRILCVRISAQGDLLDPDPIEVTQPGLHSDFSVVMAFDGTRSLLVWKCWEQFPPKLYGAFVRTDGAVGPEFQLRAIAGDSPAIVFGGDNYLVAWAGGGASGYVATRVSRSGVVLDPDGIPLNSTLDTNFNEIALGSDGTQFLAVWTEHVTEITQHLLARRIQLDGQPIGPLSSPILVSTTSFWKFSPTVAFDGANYLISWSRHSSGSTSIQLTRVTWFGSLLDGRADSNGITIYGGSSDSARHYAAGTALAAGNGHAFLAWLLTPKTSGPRSQSEGSLIYLR